jgi:hypothetical protein
MWWCAQTRKNVARNLKKNPKKSLTGPTLLEMGDYRVYQGLRSFLGPLLSPDGFI